MILKLNMLTELDDAERNIQSISKSHGRKARKLIGWRRFAMSV